MTTAKDILNQLKALGSEDNLQGMARYGILTDRAFGVKMGDVKALVKVHKGDHPLALELWATGWREARLLAAYIADPAQMTPELMEAWARSFDSWDVCDTTCGQLFAHTPHAYDKALDWSLTTRLFTKRAGFAIMAALALKASKLEDEEYEWFFNRILGAGVDDRDLVKKAVNWALRQIGKRNAALNARAIEVAEELLATHHAAARWIATDALKELRSEKVQERLKPKEPAK